MKGNFNCSILWWCDDDSDAFIVCTYHTHVHNTYWNIWRDLIDGQKRPKKKINFRTDKTW